MSPSDAIEVFEILGRMEGAGLWGRIESPFEPGRPYLVGFTPHLTSGWNGRMDFRAIGETPLEAAKAAERKFLDDEPDF